MAESEQSILTVVEVATRLRVDKKTVFGWIHRGELPALRTSSTGHWRIFVTDLERFLEQQTKKPPVKSKTRPKKNKAITSKSTSKPSRAA